jgi:phosphoribosylformimino-5-aminoimidazole carboxamide ribotide isomerase
VTHPVFVVYPAIDLMAGRAVRLRQGDPTRATTVGDDPVEVGRRWSREGAAWLHVVDLDGALAGEPRHLNLVQRLCAVCGIPVQVGGGLRRLDDLRAAFSAGAARVVLGTAALAGDLLPRAVEAFGERIAVALDVRDEGVAICGWQQTVEVPASDAAARLADAGAPRLIYTSVTRDGMLGGLDRDGLRRLVRRVGVPIIASGGVTTAADVRAAREEGAEGAIIGRALYDGRLTLAEALAAAREAA